MNYEETALAFDREGKPIETAWAYEVAIQEPEANLELYLNLVALYFMANDTGYFSAHHLEQRFVDLAYPRALRVLDIAENRFGNHPEITAWKLHLNDRVIGEVIPDEQLESVAAKRGAKLAKLLLYLTSDGTCFVDEVEELFREAQTGDTERKRYIASFSPKHLRTG